MKKFLITSLLLISGANCAYAADTYLTTNIELTDSSGANVKYAACASNTEVNGHHCGPWLDIDKTIPKNNKVTVFNHNQIYINNFDVIILSNLWENQ